jgi:TolA-binding protein
MLRLRFLPGLLVGLLLGLPLGAVVAILLLPQRPSTSGATSPEVQELQRRLERAEHDRDELTHQVDNFRVMAERMTTSFSDLERRFNTLEGEMQASEHATTTAATATPPPQPTNTPAQMPPA